MKPVKIIFFGNTRFSVIDAKALHEKFRLSAVVTFPDKIKKSGASEISPVKSFASENGIPIIEADKLSGEVIEEITKLQPDFIVVADYGLILPPKLLSLPKYTALNVHHSLLPRYRGPAPAPAAILNGDKEAGVSVIVMSGKVDAGDILMQVRYTLSPDETTDSLLTQLNILGANAVCEVIERYLNGNATPQKQDESLATLTGYMHRNDGLIDLSGNAEVNWRKIRAYGEWPGTFFLVKHGGKELKVKIKKAAYRDGALTIERVIPENKREMSYDDFLRGIR